MSRNEADTRADLIDPKLKQDGWGEVEGSYIRREVICPGRIMTGGKRGTQLSSDYVLVYRGRKLAVVEAKKESLSYTEGVRQAEDYAERLNCRIAYATNGHDIYQIDKATGKQTLVDDYMSPKALWAYTFSDTPNANDYDTTDIWRQRFSSIPFETKSGSWSPRYYQENAVNAALEAIASGGNRVLLTLATGTGKTAISFQIAWKLFNSRWSLSAQKDPEKATRRPRILFLADRNILANQAFNDFGAFGEGALARIEPSEIRRAGRVPKNASVFFTIFQTFMSGTGGEGENTPYFGEYPEDFFDFIIIDECHRGGASDESSWREILEYFSPAVQLGLTATPKRKDNVDTYDYFGEPVYKYTLKEGINDGFLTPFKVYPIVGTMDEYVYTPNDGVVIKGKPEAGKLYKEGDFNRIITIPEREKKRVHYWMDRINPKEKTIVFCATQEHAGLVRDYINQYANEQGWTKNSNYCARVTANDGQAGENDLRTFQDNQKTIPTILTTSRKLSTGVDARNVRNIVLMRPCNNMIEFKQIIGRGTRVYEGKEFFSIFDFVKAHHNFADPDWDGEPIAPDEGGGTGAGNGDGTGDGESNQPPEPPTDKKIVIKLADGKTREIKHISSVMYWNADGTPMTAHEFVNKMFSDLPSFFEDEDQLREIWSYPSTRQKLLQDLSDAGYDEEKLEGMKDLIDAKDSDVFDVLAYVAYASKTHTRHERAQAAKPSIVEAFTDAKQVEFIEFILEKYVLDGVKELALSNVTSMVALKYDTINDAKDELGSVAAVKETFEGFQKFLYFQNPL